MFTPPRVDEPELLDEHDAPRADMERSLRDLRRINRWLGGIGVYRRLLKKHGGAKSIVDVGTGTTDLLERVGGFRVGVDFNINHLLYRRSPGIHRVVGDARRLPFRDNVADVVTAAHFIHHFAPEDAASLLREWMRVAKRGVIVNDTRRHYIPLALVILLAKLRLVGRITRFDAPASVRRGYTTDEARELADAAGAARAEVVNAWPFRFGILLWK
ncbi:MAG TPA: methyltransferase domain-containing protein [Thermoanaerobaculia bacterium]